MPEQAPLLSDEYDTPPADRHSASMPLSAFNTDARYMKPEPEKETLKGTGLLAEENADRRGSIAKKKMADLVAEPEFRAAEEAATPRSQAAAGSVDKATGLTDVKLEKVAAQKGVRAVDHLMGDSPRVGPAKSAEQVALEAHCALTPEWTAAVEVLRDMLRQFGTCAKLEDNTPPHEAYAKVVRESKKTAKKAEMQPSKYEAAENTEKRKKVQRGCHSLIVPQGEFEGQAPFNQRLDALKRLSALRDGPHVVPVLPQGHSETNAQARMRLAAQARCSTAVLPAGSNETVEQFEERLQAVERTPAKLRVKQPSKSELAVGSPPSETPRAWPLLPRGKHESDASFSLRLELGVGCSVPCLPQGHHESDAEAELRLKAQKHAPQMMLWPYQPQLESLEAFKQRCDDATGTKRSVSVSVKSKLRRLSMSMRSNSERSEDGGKKRRDSRRRSSIFNAVSRRSRASRARASSAASEEAGPSSTPPVAKRPPMPTLESGAALQGGAGAPASARSSAARKSAARKSGGRGTAASESSHTKKTSFLSRMFSRKSSKAASPYTWT